MDGETLEAIFVQRHKLAQDTVARIRDGATSDAKHFMLFVGPRGCGKTHFVSLVYHRLKTIDDLNEKLRVAWLNEDKTSTTVLDLNRRVYESLSQHYPEEFPADQLSPIYDQDPSTAAEYLQELLVARLADKSALIIVENLDALFQSLGNRGQHEWRSFLQQSGKFAVLGTAQQLFPGVSDRNLPFYGFFQTAYLKSLTVSEGHDLLKNIAVQQNDTELASFLDTPEGRSRVRTLHHISGGNHRVYVVFSEFINRKSLDELVTPFEKTLDELTPYYQERLRWLTPQQRMIVEHLCTSDRALSVREIARSLFATNQAISKQLQELKQKRYVRSAKRGRESLYELSEPLMRLAMQLKDNRGGPIRLIVDFLRVWYSREELQVRLRSLDDTERMERIHVESAIAQIDCGSENLRVRALLADISELAYQEDEHGILEAVEELQAAAGKADNGRTAARVWEQLEVRFPSLRVGAPLSAEGVPPELVFLRPHPQLHSQDNVSKDHGPAPLAPGDEATLEMGYDEEDLRILAHVGDYRFGSITATLPNELPQLPPHHDTQFDESELVRTLRGSISLTIDEKHRVLAAIPRLSQFQIDELMKVLTVERSRFASLSPKHLLQLRKLERQHARDWCELLYASVKSDEAKSWLDDHADDELDDLLYVADNPTRFQFSIQQRFWSLLSVASWFIEREKQEEAEDWIGRTRDFITNLDENSTQADLLAKLANQLRRWEQHATAMAVLNEAAELSPENASIHTLRGHTLAAHHRYEEAIAEFEKAINLEPTNIGSRVELGAALCQLKRFHEAISEFDVVLEEAPGNVDAWKWKSEALVKLLRFDESLATIDEAIDRAERRSDLWCTRGSILYEAGRAAEAVDAHAKGIEIDRNDAKCFNSKAVALCSLGRYEEALESVAESIRLKPDDANAYFTQVEILLSSGHWKNGWAEAKKCLGRFPPQTVATESERYLIEIIFRSTQEQELWADRIAELCDVFNCVGALVYVGAALVQTLQCLEDEQTSSELMDHWQAAWHEVGDQHDELSFSLRLFDTGIEYLRTRQINTLLDLRVEQRAILEQLFDIKVAHDE